MRLVAAIAVAFLAVISAFSASAQVPAVVRGGRPRAHVVDETGTLSAADRTKLERLSQSIRETTKADMMVVIIPTTAGEPQRRFATALFNHWRLGNGARNDGILLFVALADRKSEIILGDGLDSPDQRSASQRIMDQVMMPHFRAGRPGRAIFDGATACVTDIVGVSAEQPDVVATPPRPATTAGVVVEPKPRVVEPKPVPVMAPPPRQPAVVDTAPLPATTVGVVVERTPAPIPEPLAEQPELGGPFASRSDPLPVPEPIPPAQPWTPPSGFQREPETMSDPVGMMVLLGGGAAAGAGGIAAIRSLSRYRRRKCSKCGTGMTLLNEGADDASLAPTERLEEQLGSVDYDIWTCPTCPYVEKSRYGAFFTSYATCPRCQAVTKSQTISRLQAPTTFSTGLERVNERCQACGWEKAFERVIPQLPDQSRSSHSHASPSSMSSSMSRSSSSSSSGSSSGGHSSGGGASGSW